MIEEQHGLKKVFNAAVKHASDPVFRADKTWEGQAAITGPYVYGTALRKGETFRLWYQVLNQSNHVGYAESRDGVARRKPELGIIEFQGSKANKVVVSTFQPDAAGGGHRHNPGVIQRPRETDVQKRYALYGFDGRVSHARVAFSPDSWHWT